jgi:phage gpG-like protein
MRAGFLRGSSSDLQGVQLDLEPLGKALMALERAGAEVGEQVMPIAAEILVSAVQEVFEREGAVAGKPKWPDLADSTKARRRGSSYKILQNTGLLAGSVTPFSEKLVAEAFSNVPYAGYHVSQRPRKKLPLRDFTDIDFESAQKEFADVLLAQLESNFSRAS